MKIGFIAIVENRVDEDLFIISPIDFPEVVHV